METYRKTLFYRNFITYLFLLANDFNTNHTYTFLVRIFQDSLFPHTFSISHSFLLSFSHFYVDS
jgi:hypothetical protein